MKPGPGLDEDYIIPLDRNNTRAIDRTGGTWLHTSRTNARKMKAGNLPAHIAQDRLKQLEVKEGVYNFTPVVLENIERLGLDYLVPIGGDDTLSFSQVLADNGVKLIAVPKTMDNDVQGPSTASASRPRSPAPRTQSTASGPPSARTSESGSSAFRPRRRLHRPVHGLRHLRPLPDPEYKFDLEHLVELLVEDKRDNRASIPSPSPQRVRSGGAARSPSTARPIPSGTSTRPTSPRSSPRRSRAAPARRRSPASSPTTCARATLTRSTRWSASPSPTWP